MTITAVFIVVTILSTLTIAFSAAWAIHGAVKKRNALKPVEYYPPRGYSPIDVMLNYYGKKSVPRELFNPLMLYWAQKGYITIAEDCKRGLKLTKIKDMPGSTTGKDKTRTVGSPTQTIQQELFANMFAESNVFYTLAATKADGTKLDVFIDNVEKRAKDEENKKTKAVRLASVIVAAVDMCISAIVMANYLGGVGMVLMFPIIGIFALWATRTYMPIERKERSIKILLTLFFCAWGGIPFIMLFALAAEEITSLLTVSVVLFGIAPVTTLFIIVNRIDIRADDNLDVYGRIESFKTFLVDAELDRLETLVEEDPDYFYDILPYCYILRITEKLKPKFDRIALDGPSWYLGDIRETLMF